MTWQLIWNRPWGNDLSKAELVDMYELAKLRLGKPKLYILNKNSTLSEQQHLVLPFSLNSDFSQNRTNISYHFSFKAGTISFSCLEQSKRKTYSQHYWILWWNINTVTKLQGHKINSPMFFIFTLCFTFRDFQHPSGWWLNWNLLCFCLFQWREVLRKAVESCL